MNKKASPGWRTMNANGSDQIWWGAAGAAAIAFVFVITWLLSGA